MEDNDCVNIPNVQCFIVMKSLNSRKYVTEVFAWQWHYYTLKTEGIKFLREYLGLPATVIPNTHKADRNQKNEEDGEAQPEEGQEGGEERRGRGRGGRGRGRGGRGRGRGRQEEGQQF
jgi:small subunit ribosomal protein S10e